MSTNRIIEGNNLEVLPTLPDGSAALIYIDPPFNTGRPRKHTRVKLERAEPGAGDRVGFGGQSYKTTALGAAAYADSFEDVGAFLMPRLEQAHRLLAADGSFFLHLDPREAHYAKVMADMVFGRDAFLNEIIWSYDYGGRSKRRWPSKHDTILWYAKDPQRYTLPPAATPPPPSPAPPPPPCRRRRWAQ